MKKIFLTVILTALITGMGVYIWQSSTTQPTPSLPADTITTDSEVADEDYDDVGKEASEEASRIIKEYEEERKKEWTRYENASLGLAFDYPASWHFTEIVNDPLADYQLFVGCISEHQPAEGSGPSCKLSITVAKSTLEKEKGVSFTEVGPYPFGLMQATRIMETSELDQETDYYTYLVSENGLIYSFSHDVGLEKDEVFQSMLKTFLVDAI